MALRACIEALRENQTSGANKVTKRTSRIFLLEKLNTLAIAIDMIFLLLTDGTLQRFQNHTFVQKLL